MATLLKADLLFTKRKKGTGRKEREEKDQGEKRTLVRSTKYSPKERKKEMEERKGKERGVSVFGVRGSGLGLRLRVEGEVEFEGERRKRTISSARFIDQSVHQRKEEEGLNLRVLDWEFRSEDFRI
jgi:hypothetical protein